MKHRLAGNRVALSLALLGSASAFAIGGATPATASYGNTAPCVTMREYVVMEDRNYDEWLSRATVRNIFDTNGTRVAWADWDDGDGYYYDEVRSYPKCSAWGNGGNTVGVLFTDYYYYWGDTDTVMVADWTVSRDPSRLVWWNSFRESARADDGVTKAQRDRALGSKE